MFLFRLSPFVSSVSAVTDVSLHTALTQLLFVPVARSSISKVTMIRLWMSFSSQHWRASSSSFTTKKIKIAVTSHNIINCIILKLLTWQYPSSMYILTNKMRVRWAVWRTVRPRVFFQTFLWWFNISALV